MRKALLAAAALPFAAIAVPASAQTVIERETIVTREVSPPVVEYRVQRAPEVRAYTARRYHYVQRPRTYVSRYYYRAPAYVYEPGYTYAATGSCDWLYRRAVETDSSYWWDRYEHCED